ncbi:C-type lectin protein [Mycena belliarum]|uniref:C-type lectin protein n=1 Tax=Mycena belliarum TaxID=1033014 RepID=A0AAD6XKN6_9AGAR|nr:C-type lectin protein [Mycena belliae]
MAFTSILSLPSFDSMHPPQPSSPFSESDGGSGSGYTTPSSSIDTDTRDKALDVFTSHVYVSTGALQVALLQDIFAKHAEGGLLSFCIDKAYTAPGSDSPGFAYAEASLGIVPTAWRLEKLKDFTYHSASCDAILNRSVLSASEHAVRASHLLAFSSAALRSIISLTSGDYTIHIVERPPVVFRPLSRTPSLSPSGRNATSGNIPSVDEWKALWAAWDLVTLEMIPPSMLHQKPIDLRHKCLFYIGHIPTFLDMLLSKAIGGEATEPKYFWKIFERGIDPHVDDPDHCHNHSEVPERDEEWPSLETILSFRTGVRRRLFALYEDLENGKRSLTRNIARTLVMTLEHEGFHVETLLYMLIQRAGTGTLPPPGFVTPPWELLKIRWDATPPPSTESVVLGPATITLGHDDSEADDFNTELEAEGRHYGWDNESPARQVHVGQFRAAWRPVTNKEFLAFWRAGKAELPKSWVEDDGEVKVRTIYGLIPMEIAAEWPVLTAYDDLAAYAKSKGGRLPTEPELRLFFDTYDVGYEGGANIGLRNWHPVPANAGLASQGGRGSNGGVWEWTTSLFENHEGLVPTNLFVGYSTDFFDTKHQTVLGASYATIPRLGRQTLRNFWQRGYGYAWVGARVVWDM